MNENVIMALEQHIRLEYVGRGPCSLHNLALNSAESAAKGGRSCPGSVPSRDVFCLSMVRRFMGNTPATTITAESETVR